MANDKKTSPATASAPTPGPWYPLSGCYDNTTKDHRTGKFPRRYVTFVRDAKPGEPGRVIAQVYGRTREETMANAHGMAAAFELLGACELIADWIDRLPASTQKQCIPELGDPEAVGLLWVYGVIDRAKGKAALTPSTSFFTTHGMEKTSESPATCQACGHAIAGKIHRFSDDPSSAFCSIDCQISKTNVEIRELKLEPITEPFKPGPVYQGPTPRRLHYDRFCECDIRYENEITVPKRHSIICFCPKCGCVTQD